MDIVAVIPVIIAAVAALAACWAAFEARKSAKATQDAAEASLAASFFDQYFDPGMAEALRVLAAWKRDKGERFAKIWIEEMKSGSAQGLGS